MESFSDRQYKLFKELVAMRQGTLKKVVASYLRRKYGAQKVVADKQYVYAIGDIPIALVAHMDTVHTTPATDVYWDREEDVIWSPQGLGADDRAGVFAIMEIIREGLRPHVIFTTDEEKGGIGAGVLSKEKKPFEDLRYMVEIDRRGSIDSVYYDCDNPDFEEYINQFGFKTDWGTYTDICDLEAEWGVAAVNLSSGYYKEHSTSEHLKPHELLATMGKVKEMLTADEFPKPFKYVSAFSEYGNYSYAYGYGSDYSYSSYRFGSGSNKSNYHVMYYCAGCSELYHEEEMFPVKFEVPHTGRIGKKWLCPDCVTKYANWCQTCNQPFEKTGPEDESIICPDCKTKLLTEGKNENESTISNS